MQYNQETEKAVMMNVPYMATPRPLSLTEDAEIQRTRKTLLILLGVCLALSVVGAIGGISKSATEHQVGGIQRGSQVGQNLIAILFYTFGIIVAYRYYPIGLRVFAWLGVITLVLAGIVVVAFLLMAIGGLTLFAHPGHAEHKDVMIAASVAVLIVLALYAATFVLTLIMVKFAFKLARLIKANKQLTIGQV